MKFNDLYQTVVVILLVCLFAVGAIAVSDWVAGDINTDTTITTDNDSDEIAGRYHRRSSTARFFSRCRRG